MYVTQGSTDIYQFTFISKDQELHEHIYYYATALLIFVRNATSHVSGYTNIDGNIIKSGLLHHISIFHQSAGSIISRASVTVESALPLSIGLIYTTYKQVGVMPVCLDPTTGHSENKAASPSLAGVQGMGAYILT